MRAPIAGEVCAPRRYTHSRVQLFRFSAVSWNSHRIHYDTAFAVSEGFPDVVVQSTLHGEALTRHALAWAGPNARLLAVSWRNAATATADEPLTWTATVRTVADDDASAPESDGGVRVSLDVSIVKEDGTPCVTGTVELSVR
ncbi:acyl dehydratase [Streptomyces sp. NPDC050263]|uniref:acyl dehydratase n=1 Tax=Streptomyces sp. NPDC050263 TaxID=3155037 RepID=UPI00341E4F15